MLRPLGLSAQEMNFVIPDPTRHANGYLAKYSLMNLIKSLVTDSKVWCGYENHWLRLQNVCVNGPAFGGLVGSARSFSHFLQDQLRQTPFFSPQKQKERLRLSRLIKQVTQFP